MVTLPGLLANLENDLWLTRCLLGWKWILHLGLFSGIRSNEPLAIHVVFPGASDSPNSWCWTLCVYELSFLPESECHPVGLSAVHPWAAPPLWVNEWMMPGVLEPFLHWGVGPGAVSVSSGISAKQSVPRISARSSGELWLLPLPHFSCMESRFWEAYENLTWAQLCQIICRLGWEQPQLQKGMRAKCSTAAFPTMFTSRE
jgi:hypothetical protein